MCLVGAVKGRAWCNEYKSAWLTLWRVKYHTNDLTEAGGRGDADSQHEERQNCVPCQEINDERKVAYLAEIGL